MSVGYGQSIFKNPDSTALRDGLGTLYRKNISYNVSTSFSYLLYKNVSLTGVAGWQTTIPNLRTQFEADPNDILSRQTTAIGNYTKYSATFTVNYSF